MAVWHELHNGYLRYRMGEAAIVPIGCYFRSPWFAFCFPQGGRAGSSSIFIGLASLRRRPRAALSYCSSVWILIHSVFTILLANWTISRALESRTAAVSL